MYSTYICSFAFTGLKTAFSQGKNAKNTEKRKLFKKYFALVCFNPFVVMSGVDYAFRFHLEADEETILHPRCTLNYTVH